MKSLSKQSFKGRGSLFFLGSFFFSFILTASPPTSKDLGTYGGWRVFSQTSPSSSAEEEKHCIATTLQKVPTPDTLPQGAFVMLSPSSQPIVVFMTAQRLQGKKPIQVRIGSQVFPFMAHGYRAYLKDPSMATPLLKALEQGDAVTLSAPLEKGSLLEETYSLEGLKKALSVCHRVGMTPDDV